jgi:heme/copper-type cytochrome/quinol oxidase subunit 4
LLASTTDEEEDTMNTMRITTLTVVMALATSIPAFAVDTAKTYSSGLLIAVFLAFCALLVVVQLMPSIMLLAGFIKGLARRTEGKVEAQAARASKS